MSRVIGGAARGLSGTPPGAEGERCSTVGSRRASRSVSCLVNGVLAPVRELGLKFSGVAADYRGDPKLGRTLQEVDGAPRGTLAVLTMTPIEPPSRVHETGPTDPRRVQVKPTPEVPVIAAEQQPFDVLPSEPPAEVLAEIGAAMDQLDALKERQLSLRFDVRDGQRLRIEVVDDEGNVIRTVPATEAIEIVTGQRSVDGRTTTDTNEPTGFDGMG
jgi:hypothetical protein